MDFKCVKKFSLGFAAVGDLQFQNKENSPN